MFTEPTEKYKPFGRFSLKNRKQGMQYSPLERKFLFARDFKHSGRVKFVNDTLFRLKKPLLTGDVLNETKYILDHKKCEKPNADQFIIIKECVRPDGLGPKRLEFMIVKEWEPFDINKFLLNYKPGLDKESFLIEVSRAWRHPDLDHIDEYIAYTLMSCPKDNFGVGGIRGDVTVDENQPLSALNKFHDVIKQFLPFNYTRRNRKYYFQALQQESTYNNALNSVINRSFDEYGVTTYPQKMKLVLCELPSQFPINLRNSIFKGVGKDGFNYDVYQYYIHSWYLNQGDIFNFGFDKKTVTSRLNYSHWEVSKFIMDECPQLDGVITTDSIARMAITLSRLEQKPFKLDHFAKASTLIKKNIKRYTETAPFVYDRGSTYNLISDNARLVLLHVQRLEDSETFQDNVIPIKHVQSDGPFNKWDWIIFDKAIGELSMKNRILFKENQTKLKLIHG